MESLSGWQPPRSPNHKLCRYLVVRNLPQHRRLVTGRQLYRQRIPLQECLDNPSVLVQMSSPGHVGRHLVQDTKEDQKCLVRNPREKSMLETPSGLKGIQVMPQTSSGWSLLINVSRTLDSVPLLFLAAGHPTWENPSPSQKKHLWSISLRTGYFLNRRAKKGKP